MRSFFLKAALVMILLSSALIWLYLQSRQISSESLFQITSMTHEIIAIDSSMERDVLRLKIGRLQHYDTVTDSSKLLDDIFHGLKSNLEKIPELQESLSALEASITVQKGSLDRFERSNSLLRNSLRFFSVAINETVANDPESYPFLAHIYNDLLQTMSTPESKTMKHLEDYLESLKENGHEAIARHLLLTIERSEQVEESVFSFIHGGTEENSEALLRAYENYYDLQLKRSEGFRVMLFFFSALLVLFIGFVGYRLLNAASELRNAVAELQYQKFALDEHALVAVTDQKGDITYANQKFCEISGYSQEELLGKNHRILKSDYHSDAFYKQMWRTIASGKAWHGEIKNRAKS
ncbi:MAG: DAHL domain-containing protein, partial [Mariprofundaceae bacterium]